jgi:non-ribosomal peptide synthetase component F
MPYMMTGASHSLENPVQRQAFNRFTTYSLSSRFSTWEDFSRSELADMNASVYPALPSDGYRPAATMSLERLMKFGARSDPKVTSTIVNLAWSILLSHYTDSEAVVFGVTTTGRCGSMPGVGIMSGVAIATTPFRVRLQSDMWVGEALHGVQEQETRMIPVEQLELHTISRLSADAVAASQFRCLLVMQPEPHPDRSLFHEVTQDQDLGNHAAFATYALVLVCNLDIDFVKVQAAYDKEVIPEEQMQRMLNQFAHILQQVTLESQTRVADLSALDREDIEQLKSWNGEIPEKVDTCVHILISQQALSQPDAPAVCASDGDISYGELEQLSSRPASFLTSKVVGPEVFVPLFFENSEWTTVAILGVLKAGGAFVLLDPSYPLSRLKEICGEIRGTVVVSSIQHIETAKQIASTAIPIGDDKTARCESQRNMAGSTVKPQNTLYSMFTSGSTGKPKGVIIESAAFATSARAYNKTASLNSDVRAS